MIYNVNDENFNEAFGSGKKYLVVDVWADWCGPCKMFAKTFKSVSNIFDDLLFLKANAEENDDLCNKYKIRNLPTVLLLDMEGNVVDKFTGLKKEEDFKEFLLKHLS